MSASYSRLLEQMLQAFQNQQLEAANTYANMILRLNSKDLVALQVQGLSLAMQGRVAESVSPLYKAAKLDPNNPELLTNLVKAQQGAGMFTEAISSYRKLDRLLPNNAQVLTDMGTALAKSRFYDEAQNCFNKAIHIQPDYFLVWSNQGNLFAELGLAAEAIASYEKALGYKSDYPETWTNYGNALFDLGRFQEARLAHEQALHLNSEYAEAWSNYGNTLLELKDAGDYAAYQKAYSLKPDHPYLLGQLFGAATTRCDWKVAQSLEPLLISQSNMGQKVAHPFALLQTSASIELQKKVASIFVNDRIGLKNTQPRMGLSAGTHREKIRIGYFSSDFKDHPVGVLCENLFPFHDRTRFEVYGFFLNASTGDPIEQRIANACDAVFHLHGMGEVAAVNLIRAQNLDLAIDLNGHTSGARMALFANKLAPIQVNYLGYAGSSGADFYDALIADEVVIPRDHQMHYSEPIVYLPNSFFPVDSSISTGDFGDLPLRKSVGLPENGFVFACFNNAYKITSPIFDLWMDLLRQVPGSVLWLSQPNSIALSNLQNEAQLRGVDPARLIFASRIPSRSAHLSRLRLANLFLDTPNYNAHATAADALWAGVPVLTLMGDTFAARVAASQLTAVGLTELITHSKSEYFAKALALAQDPKELGQIRARLAQSHTQSPLFNTKQYAQDLETLYSNLLDSAKLH